MCESVYECVSVCVSPCVCESVCVGLLSFRPEKPASSASQALSLGEGDGQTPGAAVTLAVHRLV